MVGDVKYRNLEDRCFEQWKDVPKTSIYYLVALIKNGKSFFLKLQWEGTSPDRGIDYLMHYGGCESCRINSKMKGGYAVLLFCDSRFVYGYDLRNDTFLPHDKEYKQYLRSTANGFQGI